MMSKSLRAAFSEHLSPSAAIACCLVFGIFSAVSCSAEPVTQQKWLPATPQKLPRWRGFNLLEKFYWNKDRKPFLEEDFRLIAKMGFNFVRLPMDYRCWIMNGDWEQFDEATLKEIDQAVEWGGKYGIHVCLNFHRAPGYTVAQPAETKSLWTDPEAQRVCARHWAMFARRYKGIPSERLSFNLMNEPSVINPTVYVSVGKQLAEAICSEDPNRLIIADGVMWGNVPVPELRALNIAEATRGYAPMEISHDQASWVGGERFPMPSWPRAIPSHGTLYGPAKPDLAEGMLIKGPFQKATDLRLRVLTVSQKAALVVEADGNWMQVGEIGLKVHEPEAREDSLSLDLAWGKKPDPITYTPGSPAGRFTAGDVRRTCDAGSALEGAWWWALAGVQSTVNGARGLYSPVLSRC